MVHCEITKTFLKHILNKVIEKLFQMRDIKITSTFNTYDNLDVANPNVITFILHVQNFIVIHHPDLL